MFLSFQNKQTNKTQHFCTIYMYKVKSMQVLVFISPLNYHDTFVENQLCVYFFFLIFGFSISVTYMFIVSLIPYSLDYHSFKEVLKSESLSPPILVFHLNLFWSSKLNFHINFRISLFISQKNEVQILLMLNFISRSGCRELIP